MTIAPWIVDPTAYKTDKNTWDDAFAAALAEVVDSRQAGVCRKVLVIPPGQYTLTKPWITSPVLADQIQGLHIIGQGKRVTEIDYAGSDPLVLAENRLRNFRMSGLTFRSTNSKSTWGYFYSDDKGGSIVVTGGSWIMCGPAGGRFFYMPNQTHYDSVQHLTVIGTRFEVRNTNTKIIDCGWHGTNAHIEWINISDTAQGFQPWAANTLTHVYGAPSAGPVVGFTGSELMGFHQVRSAAADLTYTRCNFKNNPSGFGAGKFLRSNTGQATYRFA